MAELGSQGKEIFWATELEIFIITFMGKVCRPLALNQGPLFTWEILSPTGGPTPSKAGLIAPSAVWAM